MSLFHAVRDEECFGEVIIADDLTCHAILEQLYHLYKLWWTAIFCHHNSEALFDDSVKGLSQVYEDGI